MDSKFSFDDAARFDRALHTWEQDAASRLPAWDVDAEWHVWRTRQDLTSRETSMPLSTPLPRRQPSVHAFLTSRAFMVSLGVLCGLGGIVLAGWLGTRSIASTYARTSTGNEQLAHLTLDDGSRVTLAPNSSLDVATNFSSHRDIVLTGQAYFEVVPGRIPFLVHTNDVTTRVVGTSFDIQHYGSDSTVRVTVTTGKVTVGGMTHRSVTLTAGMTAVVGDSSIVTAASVDAPVVGWMDGQLVFHKASTGEVLAALTRWYGYQFRLADTSLAHRNLTLGVSTESSSAALATLKLMLDVDLTFDHNVVTLSPRRATHAIPRASRHAPNEPNEMSSPPQTEVGR